MAILSSNSTSFSLHYSLFGAHKCKINVIDQCITIECAVDCNVNKYIFFQLTDA